jgi:hypothetical protein
MGTKSYMTASKGEKLMIEIPNQEGISGNDME